MSTFSEVLDVFGGSIFPEDYRADLQEIQRRLDSTLASGALPSDRYEEANASHDLIRSIYQAHCGNHREAESALNEVLNHQDLLPPRWKLRCVSYQIFHLVTRRFPPMLRFRTEQDSINRWLRDAEMSWPNEGLHLIGKSQQLHAELRDGLSELDQIEAFLMAQLVMTNFHLCYHAMVLHPAHPQGAWNLPDFKPMFVKNVTEFVTNAFKLSSTLHANGFHCVAVNLTIRLLQVLAACDQKDDVSVVLQEGLQLCTNHVDEAGRALYKMFEADVIVSPPFSHPIALNLIAIDSGRQSCSSLLWDSCEDALELRAHPSADELYDTAFGLFEQCGSSRGLAAVKIRRVSFSVAKLVFDAVADATARQSQLIQIEQELDVIATLFGDDEVGIQVVRGFQILMKTLSGQTNAAISIAKSVGAWGLRVGNEGIAHFIGSLLMKCGQRHWKDCSRVDTALICFTSAESVFESLNNPIATFQAINAQTELHDAISNSMIAGKKLRQSINMFDTVMTTIDRQIEGPNHELVKDNLAGTKHLLVIGFHALVKIVFNKSREWADLQAWDTRILDKGLIFPSTFDDAQSLIETGQEFNKARWKADLLLSTFDTVGARNCMGEFCEWLQSVSAPEKIKIHYRILANYLDGSSTLYEFSRADLDQAEEHNYYSTCEIETVPIFSSDAPWCRNKYDRALKEKGEVDNALSRCVMAGDWGQGARLLRAIQKASPGFLDPAGPDRTVEQWTRLVWAGLITERSGELLSAMKIFLMAERQLLVRRSKSQGPDAKISSLSTLNTTEVFLGLARVSIKCNKMQVPITTLEEIWEGGKGIQTWEQAALVFLERGRARTLLDSLWDVKPVSNLDNQTPDLTRAYQYRLREHLRAASETTSELADLDLLLGTEAIDLNMHPNEVIHDIPPTSEQYTCLDKDTLFVEFGFSVYESVVIAATASGIKYAGVHPFKRQEIREPVYRVLRLINSYKDVRKRQFQGEPMTEEMRDLTPYISSCLAQISNLILKPISELIRSSSHVVFSAGHPLMSFPFSALPLDDKPLFLSVAVSAVPSLAVYARLSSQRQYFTPKVAAITKPGTIKDLIKTGEYLLPLAAIEAMIIANDFGTWPYMAKQISSDAFCKIMEECTIMHIGTHGAIHTESPWLSYISLRKNFRVIELSRARTKASLVVFAACQSGLGKAEGDEMLGFATSTLQSGSAAYLGALWEVDDVATMMLMIHFYRAIKGNKCDTARATERSVAKLWTTAMRAFYELDHTRAGRLIDEMVEDLDQCAQRGNNPDTILVGAREKLLNLREKISIDFRHPFFYASFALTGFGGLICELPDRQD